MKSNVRLPISAFCLLTAGQACAAEPLPLSAAYWRDPAFQKAFNASYRIEARIEPTVSAEERALLVEIQGLMEKDQRKEALAKLAASPLTAGSAALRFNLGNLYFEEGKVEEAIAAYGAALGEYPSFRRAHRNLAVARVREGDLEGALEPLIEAIRLGDSEGATYGLLGYCRLQRGEWASALQAYRLAQVSEPDTAEWKAGIAQCLQNLNARDEAVALLDEVIQQRPLEGSYAVLQASILLELGRHDDAVKALELPRRLAQLDPDGLLLLADLHLRAGRREAARLAVGEAFGSAGEASPGRVTALAATAMGVRDWEFAGELLDRAKAGEGDAPRVLRLLRARLQIESGSAPAEGGSGLAELIQEDPTDGEALLALGKYRAAGGQPAEAELIFERATAAPASATEAWIELARLRVAASRYPAALAAVDAALELSPNEELRAYRGSLARLIEAAE
jgi:tetratricopeptide (TPR) repeat protein